MTYCINCKNTKANRQQIEDMTKNMNKTYNSVGLSVKTEYDTNNIMVMISINETKATRSTTRNAGRHKAYSKYKCKDIADLQQQGLTADEIAQKLEMSRSTYFRHLKRMSEHNNMDRYF